MPAEVYLPNEDKPIIIYSSRPFFCEGTLPVFIELDQPKIKKGLFGLTNRIIYCAKVHVGPIIDNLGPVQRRTIFTLETGDSLNLKEIYGISNPVAVDNLSYYADETNGL